MRKFSVALAATMMLPLGASAQTTGTVIEQSSEYRFQLDLAVNPAALAKLLPAGWESAAAAQGPAKDCNLRLIFIDRVNITGPDNKPLGAGSDRLAILAAPVKQTGGAGTGQMILAGISENNPDAAGAFGTLLKASRVKIARATAETGGDVTVTEDWDFTAAGGEHMQVHLKFARGAAGRNAGEVKFYNPADPSQLRLVRTDVATDLLRNVTTTPPDRVKEFSFHAGGGKIAALLDGSERPLSWDSQPTYSRIILMP